MAAYTSTNAFSARGTLLQYIQPSSSPAAYITVTELRKLAFTGTKLDTSDVTNMQSGVFREYIATLLDSGELTFEGNYVPNDATQDQVFRTFFNTAKQATWQIVLPSTSGVGAGQVNSGTGIGGNIVFVGWVASVDISLPVDKEGTISGKIKITGAITIP
jgi:predicted secreted protein